MIECARGRLIEIGGPVSSLMPEVQMKAGKSRKLFLKKLKEVIKYWPVIDRDQETTIRQIECLHNIMQDPGKDDSKQLVVIYRTSRSRHFVTMDYRFYRRFNQMKSDIFSKCKIDMAVMTPSEFMEQIYT
ncbi:MAG: hypothetical protein M0017_03220, partial [Desulfobacteraceae bacterium]|nr:hypothetical protein [Desulfobacteraceae bacterium]